MPMNPANYAKIFKSKYVQDDDEDVAGLNLTNDDVVSEEPASSSYVPPAYSNPKVQELLSKPKPNFDKIFSSRYVDEGVVKPLSFRSSSVETPVLRKSYTPVRDYDKVFTSKYLEETPSKPLKRGFNPYLTEEDEEDEPVIRHLPPSRSSSIRRSMPPSRYNESVPTSIRRNFESKPLRNLVVSRSVTPSSTRSYDLSDVLKKEESPVVFDANLTFILGCKSQVKQNVKPIPAHQEADTQSCALSSKIADFLNRTDHVMQEWESVGKKKKKQKSDVTLTGKSKSATNIMIKGFQLYSQATSADRSRRCESEDTQNEIDEVLRAKNPLE